MLLHAGQCWTELDLALGFGFPGVDIALELKIEDASSGQLARVARGSEVWDGSLRGREGERERGREKERERVM